MTDKVLTALGGIITMFFSAVFIQKHWGEFPSRRK